MKLPNIWEICTFSDEIVYGIFDQSKFAVELHSILDNTADPVYKDPELFLSKTYLTQNMKYLLKAILLRIARNEGNPVYIIDTEFGGGKTHTLLLLYHIFKNRRLGTEYIHQYNIDKECNVLEVPEVRVTAIDCTMVKKNTLWGEIAYAMGKYDLLRELDERKSVPKDITVLKNLFDKPTLLLIDELPHYLLKADSDKIGNVTLADLTILFIRDLIGAVSSVNNSVLIITLTAKQKLYESYVERVNKSIRDFRTDNLMSDLRESVSRQTQYIVPVNKEEVYNVIVKRLIKDKKDDYKNVVNTYYEYYSQKGLISDPNYKERMLKAYPFHPFLIDTLYERVSSIDKFNKTRGMLRLLALVLHDIYKNRRDCKIVSTGDVNLSEELIKESLTDHIERGDMKRAIESDCIDKARRLDMSKSIKLVEKVARTIFIYSLIGATRISGIRPNELKLAVCYPDIDTSLVDNILQEIDKEFWYLRSENDQYYFSIKPNINKVIYDYMKDVRDQEIKDKIKDTLADMLKANNIFRVYIGEKEIPDDERLKLVVIDYDEIDQDDDKNRRVFESIISRAGNNIRTYQNTIILLYPEYHGIESLKNAARLVIAATKAKDDERIKMDHNDVKAIKQRIEEFNGNLMATCKSTYSKIAYPYSSEIRIDTLPSLYATKEEVSTLIKEQLKKKGKLIESINPDVIREMVDRNRIIHVKDIYNDYLKNRSERFVVPPSRILDGVKEGVAKGLFGYADGLDEIDGMYKASIGVDIEPKWDGYIIHSDLIYVKMDKESKAEQQSTTATIRTVSYPHPSQQREEYRYRYTIRSNNIEEIIRLLSNINIIVIGKEHSKALSAVLTNAKNDTIEIKSGLNDLDAMKSLLRQLSSLRFNIYDTASIEIKTYEDISEELSKHNIKYERG